MCIILCLNSQLIQAACMQVYMAIVGPGGLRAPPMVVVASLSGHCFRILFTASIWLRKPEPTLVPGVCDGG